MPLMVRGQFRMPDGRLEAFEAKTSVLSLLVAAYKDFPSGTERWRQTVVVMIEAATDELYREFVADEQSDEATNRWPATPREGA
jgi:hypothetical protein